MTITILAVLFLLFIFFITYIGKKTVLRPPVSPEEANSERCAICREKYGKEEMILRQIGDYKLLYFCKSCIENLAKEISS